MLLNRTVQETHSQSQLNPRLWLHCRLSLIRSLPTHTAAGRTAIRKWALEGAHEAELFGDVETRLEFLLQAALVEQDVEDAAQKLQVKSYSNLIYHICGYRNIL